MPITVTCPHCGTTTVADDKFGGTSGPCRQCGQTISIPAGNVYAQDASTPEPVKSSNSLIPILVIVGGVGLVGLLIVGVLAALLLPAVQSAREAARRAQCMNNIRSIELALLNYESEHGEFPPAYTVDDNGQKLHSWRVLILPYLGENNLYSQLDLSKPWDDPQNVQLAQAFTPMVYRCPSSPGGAAYTNYLGVAGPGAVFDGPRATKIADVTDGTTNTMSVVEVINSDVLWFEPRDVDAARSAFAVSTKANEIGSHHPGGANAGYVDGSVHFISEAVDPKLLRSQSTMAGGD